MFVPLLLVDGVSWWGNIWGTMWHWSQA